MNASSSLQGTLATKHIRAPKTHKARVLRIPGVGRISLTRGQEDALKYGSEAYATNLCATHKDGDGKVKHEYDLGSGLVTNIGALALANDINWSATLNLATLATQNFHAVGTGVTAAAATDFRLQALAAPTTATAVTGTQTRVAPVTFVGPTYPIYQNVATVNFTTSLAITEWGLHSQATLSSPTGTPFTAATVGTFTCTATPFTASSATVRGLQQSVVLPGTTTVLGLIQSNTTSVGTLVQSVTPTGWYTQALQAAGATPGATEAFAILPVMFDHKVFGAINVVNGDSIQFTYQLSINSGT